MGVDHGGDGVGGVVETVDELETQRDQQRQAEQGKDAERQRFMDAANVVEQAMDAIADAQGQENDEDDAGGRAGAIVKFWGAGPLM